MGRDVERVAEVRAADAAVTLPTSIERVARRFPHRPDRGLRLACQCRVLGDVEVEACGGLGPGSRRRSLGRRRRIEQAVGMIRIAIAVLAGYLVMTTMVLLTLQPATMLIDIDRLRDADTA